MDLNFALAVVALTIVTIVAIVFGQTRVALRAIDTLSAVVSEVSTLLSRVKEFFKPKK